MAKTITTKVTLTQPFKVQIYAKIKLIPLYNKPRLQQYGKLTYINKVAMKSNQTLEKQPLRKGCGILEVLLL